MSTDSSSLDPQLIEETKQQIRSLVSEIAQLSKADVAPEEFYGQFLTRVVSALAAIGGAVWTTNDEGRLALQHQINLQQTKLRDNEEGQAQHGRLLYKCLTTAEGMLVPPHSGAGEEGGEQVANPTDFLLVLGPLKTDLEVVGVLEIIQRSEPGPTTQRGYLRFVLQMCELAGDFLKSHQLRHFSDRQVLWTQLEEFTRRVHTSLEPREAAYTIANEGRRLIECDRVSVAIRRGNKCKIEAISGQDVFDKRSNTVRLLGKLATAVVATGDPVWYAGDTRDMAPQVEDAIQEYIDESHSKNVAVLPLKRPQPTAEEDPDSHREPEPPVGALIVEQIEDSRVPATMVQRVEVVCRHSSTALANAMEHQSLFLMPVWRMLGKSRWVLRARTLPKTLTIAGIVLVALLALIFWPINFNVHCKGKLEPVICNNVFARVDGIVDELFVEHGYDVKKDQLLARLRSTTLDMNKEDLEGKLRTTAEKISATDRELARRGLSRSEQDRLEGDLRVLRKEEESLKTQLDLFQDKLEDLNVKSPITGTVLSWELRKRLERNPVQKGQILMEVANLEGPWWLELEMPEDRMGYIAQAQQELQNQLRAKLRRVLEEKLGEVPDEQLEAELAKVPDKELTSRLRQELGGQLYEDLHSKLAAVHDQLEDEAQRAQLEYVLASSSYEQMRTRLEDMLRPMPRGPLHDGLRDLLDDGLDSRLTVTFIPATDPHDEFQGKITDVDLNAEIHGDEGNAVRIKVEIDKKQLPHLRRGVTINASVACGKRPIGYVWFHDILAFIHSRILFRYF
jgi:multidrug efflux pump subunit AcrA (membrane-fusion protein)